MSEEFFASAKITVRKQIAIPKKVQEKLGGVEEGDYILFYETPDGKIFIKKGKIKPL